MKVVLFINDDNEFEAVTEDNAVIKPKSGDTLENFKEKIKTFFETNLLDEVSFNTLKASNLNTMKTETLQSKVPRSKGIKRAMLIQALTERGAPIKAPAQKREKRPEMTPEQHAKLIEEKNALIGKVLNLTAKGVTSQVKGITTDPRSGTTFFRTVGINKDLSSNKKTYHIAVWSKDFEINEEMTEKVEKAKAAKKAAKAAARVEKLKSGKTIVL
jgi:hypothetical protein